MIATYYRGRTTFTELMNMPLDYVNTLWKIAEERTKAEQEEKEKAEANGEKNHLTNTEAMYLQDEMEAAIT